MAFNLNKVVVAGEHTELTETLRSVKQDNLTKQELEYLLGLLKNTDLKGYQIEMFYSLVVKLQNQYIIVNK